ncbi:MAG: CHAT domain-containing protein [Pseudomonadota bacterium]
MNVAENILTSGLRATGKARALAYAGAVEAMGLMHRSDIPPLEIDLNTVPWAFPGETADQLLDGLAASDLAQRWQDEVRVLGPMRLLVDENDFDFAERRTDVLPILGQVDPSGDGNPAILLIATSTIPLKFDWSWPPRLRLTHHILATYDADPPWIFQQDLAKAVRAKDTWPSPIGDYDYLETGEFPNDRVSGMYLSPIEQLDQFDATIDGLPGGISGRLVAFLNITWDEAPGFMVEFVRELCHDHPPDAALAIVQHQLRKATGPTFPLIVAGVSELLPTALERARAGARLEDLLLRLEDVRATEPLDPAMAVGLYGRGPGGVPRTIGGLRARLRQILANRRDFFRRELDEASDIAFQESLAEEPLRLATPISDQDVPTLSGPPPEQTDRLLSFDEASPIGGQAVASEDTSFEADEPPPFEQMVRSEFRGGGQDADTDGSPAGAPETDRFLDLDIYEGSDAASPRLNETATIQPAQTYSLGIAIRAERTGIAATSPAPVVTPPREAGESVTLWAVISTSTPDAITLGESAVRITWPYDSDTDEVFVPFTTGAAPAGTKAEIEIRLYSAQLEYLDQVSIQGLVIGGPSQIVLHRAEPKPAVMNSDSLGRDIALQLHEEPSASGFRFTLLAHAGPGAIRLMVREVTRDDAAAILDDMRTQMEALSTGVFKHRDGISEQLLNTKLLPELVKIGERAWTTFFGPPEDPFSQFMSDFNQTENQTIQVTKSAKPSSFAFPWAFLHRPTTLFEPDPTDWDGFWGLRHLIEVWPGNYQRSGLDGLTIAVSLAEDKKFPELPDHRQALTTLASGAGIDLNSPFTSDEMVLRSIAENPTHLYYFFCHGFAPDPHSLPRKMRDASGLPTEPTISFTGGEIAESTLTKLPLFQTTRPIFFLNMCQSAEIEPGSTGGLVRVLLGKGATCVLGTETEMTAVFATTFAEVFFRVLFEGNSAGVALLAARRYALRQGNPLGLAYSLYGRGDAKLGPTPQMAIRALRKRFSLFQIEDDQK